MKYCFGVDIGGTTVKMGLFEATGTILEKWEIKTHTEEEGKAILPDVAASLREKKAEHDLADSDIIGVGVGVPAPVTEEGIVFGSANLGWKYKEVKKELEELTGLDVEVGNDANVAALGEMWKGGGAGYKNLIMVTLGTGVGGGIIVGKDSDRKPRSRRRDRASSSKSSRNRKLRMWRKGMPGAVCICNRDCASCKKKTGAGDKKHDFKQE
mgnify:CR=1 FL=1